VSKNPEKNKKKKQVKKEKPDDSQLSVKHDEMPGLQDYRSKEE
jgi:hypothetical protein